MKMLLCCPYGHDSEFERQTLKVYDQITASRVQITCLECRRVFQIDHLRAIELDINYEHRIIIAQWAEIREIETETALHQNPRNTSEFGESIILWHGPELRVKWVNE